MKSFAEIKAECEKDQEARKSTRENAPTVSEKRQSRDRKPCPKCGSYCFGSCSI